MSDQALRALEREAATGGTEAQARLLRARLRAGEVTRERVELAAYCGSEAAQAVAGSPIRLGRLRDYCSTWDHFANDLPAWTHALGRWGQPVMVRAACAAARVALPVWTPISPDELRDVEWALSDAESWVRCPCRGCLEDWEDSSSRGAGGPLPSWVPREKALAASIQDAARLAGEEPVRAAICEALVTWALGAA